MGQTSSRATAKLSSNTVIVNQSDINLLNKTVNNLTVDMMIESAKSCSSSIVQNQDQIIGSITAGGKSNISLTQEQAAKLDFSCLQKDNVQFDIINKITDTMKNQINNTNNSEVLNKMVANVQAKAQDQWGSFPWSGSKSDVNINQEVNTFVQNNTKVNLSNVVENASFANFKTKLASDCIGKIIQSQKQIIGSIAAEDQAVIALTQKQAADALIKCVQDSNIAQQIVTDVVKFVGLNLEIQNDTKSDTNLAADGKAESETQGFFQGVSGFFTGLFSGFGSYGPMLSSLLIFFCCCLFCLVIISFVFGGSIIAFFKNDKQIVSDLDVPTETIVGTKVDMLMKPEIAVTDINTSPANL